MLDFGQFDFGQFGPMSKLADVEIWPKSEMAEVEQMVFALFLLFLLFLFSSHSFPLSFFLYLFLCLVLPLLLSRLTLHFLFVLFLFLSPKTFALNLKPPNPKPSVGPPSAPPSRWTPKISFFSLFFETVFILFSLSWGSFR